MNFKFLKFRALRIISQSISLYFLFPLFFAVFYCPYTLPWISCNFCTYFWCPSKYMRKATIFFIGISAIFAGRVFCSFSCPFGFFQDIINFFSRKISKSKDLVITRNSKIKFLFLFIAFIFALNLSRIISIKILNEFPSTNILLSLILAISIFVAAFSSRFFCRFLCPLGALISISNKLSLLKLKFKEKLCNKCKICKEVCEMKINNKKENVDLNSTDCIICFECLSKCPKNAIRFSHRF
ncbi:MAG: 4Fe-4S binding protein [Candidatus Altiarchaeota archaeon]